MRFSVTGVVLFVYTFINVKNVLPLPHSFQRLMCTTFPFPDPWFSKVLCHFRHLKCADLALLFQTAFTEMQKLDRNDTLDPKLDSRLWLNSIFLGGCNRFDMTCIFANFGSFYQAATCHEFHFIRFVLECFTDRHCLILSTKQTSFVRSLKDLCLDASCFGFILLLSPVIALVKLSSPVGDLVLGFALCFCNAFVCWV